MMMNSKSIKENGIMETPVHHERSTADKGGRTTFSSQRIAWRNGNTNSLHSNTVVTPSATETSTPVTPSAAATTEAACFDTSTTHAEYDNSNPYESILQDSAKWKRQLESVRDEIYFLQVQNAMHLDYLTMAGADE
jgi:hypothetical protein